MEIYYKTKKTSETGIKVQNIVNKTKEFDKNINDLRKKYGFKDHFYSGLCLRGILAVSFRSQPDIKLWKKVKGTEGYYPRSSFKEAYNDFKKIIPIYNHELNQIVGQKNVFHQCGYSLDHKDFFIFSFEAEWNTIIPEDLIEINASEYLELYGKSKD